MTRNDLLTKLHDSAMDAIRETLIELQDRTADVGEIQRAGSDRTGHADPEASISARLRDFRKHGLSVERRRRGDPRAGLWEYRVLVPAGVAL